MIATASLLASIKAIPEPAVKDRAEGELGLHAIENIGYGTIAASTANVRRSVWQNP